MAHTPFDQEWTSAKAEFEKITGVKKPKESKGILNAFGSHTGLSGALKKCEAGYQLCNNTVDTKVAEGKKAAKAFAATAKAFKAAEKSYLAVLKKAVDDEFAKRPDPKTKSTYERGLKFLQKELDALDKTIEASVASNIQKFDKAAQSLSVKEKMLQNWNKNIAGALARAAAQAAKVKANPTPTAYNALFPTAARDITMQLVFARDIPGLKGDPDIFLKKLAPWANQNSTGVPVKVPDDYTPKQITDLIAQFTAEVKKVAVLAAR